MNLLESYNVFVKEDGEFKQIYPVSHSTQGTYRADGGALEVSHVFTYIENDIYSIGVFKNADVRFKAKPFTQMITGEL